MEAPLSSPSLSQQPTQYFNSMSSSTSAASARQHAQAQHNYNTRSAALQQQQQAQAQTLANQQRQQTQSAPSHATDTTSPFLRDFNLVAEAAKRAQMAVLMRDMEAVGL